MSTAGDAPQAAARPRRGPRKKKSIRIPRLLREQGNDGSLNKHWRAYRVRHAE